MMKSVFKNPSKSYLEVLREEAFAREPLASFISNSLTKTERQALLRDENYWLVAERYEWRGRVEPILEGIIAACDEVRDEKLSLLEQAWIILPTYIKRFWKFHSRRRSDSNLVRKLRLFHFIITGEHIRITEEKIKRSFSLPEGCFLSLDTGCITNEISHCLTLGHLLSQSRTKLVQAMTMINNVFELDIDNILSIIVNSKGSRYYNITTGKRVNTGTTHKWPYCDDDHKIVAGEEDKELFLYITELLNKPFPDELFIPAPPIEVKPDISRKVTPRAIIRKEPTKKRRNIPSKIRFLTWREFIGTDIYGKCWCCGDEISYENWHAGHVIPASKGGPDVVENLRPVCPSCNLSMGNEYMGDYIRHYKMKGEGAKEFADYNLVSEIDELADRLINM